MQTVREGLDGTSSGDPSPYEALERLKQDVRLEKNSRAWAETSAKQAWAIIRRLLSDFERPVGGERAVAEEARVNGAENLRRAMGVT